MASSSVKLNSLAIEAGTSIAFSFNYSPLLVKEMTRFLLSSLSLLMPFSFNLFNKGARVLAFKNNA